MLGLLREEKEEKLDILLSFMERHLMKFGLLKKRHLRHPHLEIKRHLLLRTANLLHHPLRLHLHPLLLTRLIGVKFGGMLKMPINLVLSAKNKPTRLKKRLMLIKKKKWLEQEQHMTHGLESGNMQQEH